jgi:hypothetical protein
MMKFTKTFMPVMLGAAMAISVAAVAQDAQSSQPTGLPTKDQQKAERAQEKQQEKVAKDNEKAAKAQEKSVKAQDKARQKSEKAQGEQAAQEKKTDSAAPAANAPQ